MNSALNFYAFIVYSFNLAKIRKHNIIVECNSSKMDTSFILVADLL